MQGTYTFIQILNADPKSLYTHADVKRWPSFNTCGACGPANEPGILWVENMLQLDAVVEWKTPYNIENSTQIIQIARWHK